MSVTTRDSESVRILWTGGWDSTFQLLQLLISEGQSVLPFYVIDEGRRSADSEMLAMETIRKKIYEMDSRAKKLLHPTQFFSASDLPEEPGITKAFEALRATKRIGGQYEWIARFCAYRGISDLQLCIHEDDKATAVISSMVTARSNNESPFKIDDKYSGTDEYIVFKYFTFPILRLTKKEMDSISRELGWHEIMMQTWFCHFPRNGKPCGRCNPCLYTIDEGLGWRIPLSRRLYGPFHNSMAHRSKTIIRRIARMYRRGPQE